MCWCAVKKLLTHSLWPVKTYSIYSYRFYFGVLGSTFEPEVIPEKKISWTRTECVNTTYSFTATKQLVRCLQGVWPVNKFSSRAFSVQTLWILDDNVLYKSTYLLTYLLLLQNLEKRPAEYCLLFVVLFIIFASCIRWDFVMDLSVFVSVYRYTRWMKNLLMYFRDGFLFIQHFAAVGWVTWWAPASCPHRFSLKEEDQGGNSH